MIALVVYGIWHTTQRKKPLFDSFVIIVYGGQPDNVIYKKEHGLRHLAPLKGEMGDHESP
jgi:hypothetical protein